MNHDFMRARTKNLRKKPADVYIWMHFMAKCEFCGKEVVLPFQCSFCMRYFCIDHRLPENHSCFNAPSRTPIGHWKAKVKPFRQQGCPKCGSTVQPRVLGLDEKWEFLSCRTCGLGWKQPRVRRKEVRSEVLIEQKRSRPVSRKPLLKKILALSLVIIILGIIFYNSSSIISFIQKSSRYQSSQPYSQQELIVYALSLINSARQSNAVQNVSLSTVTSAQQHADNMLEYRFFSHWDMNGYKPHMRYSLAGGKGSVSENIAWNHYPSGIGDVKEAIKDLETGLEMSFWHWANIVTATHNKVSIGIAYDNDDIYLVQNFENDYITWSTMSVSKGEVTMGGAFQKEGLSIQHVTIYYDEPMNLAVEQLKKPPYNASYDMGTFVGMALPEGWESLGGITITAKRWVQIDRTFEIRFDLSPAFNSYGIGVYTLCLQSDSENTFTENNSLTSYSIWHD